MPTKTLARCRARTAGACAIGALAALFAAGMTFAADAPRVPVVNAKPEAHLPGKFIWFDCVTEDAYASKAFYGALFGWDFHSIGDGANRYTLISSQGRNIGGLHFHPRGNAQARGSRWISLMSVADPALAARYVEAHGGKVVVPPTPFAGRGTHALFRDDDGALFGVLKSDSGDPPDRPAAAGEFQWVDLFTHDPAKAAEFYRGLAAFEVSVKGVAPELVRVVLGTGGVARASLIALPKDVADSGWLPFVQVDDVAAAVRKAAALGGTVLLAPRADLLNGHVAVIADPHGGVLGVVNRAEAAKKGGAK